MEKKKVNPERLKILKEKSGLSFVELSVKSGVRENPSSKG